MAAPTRHSFLADLNLSDAGKERLEELGLKQLNDLEDADLGPYLVQLQESGARSDARNFFAILIRSGVAFKINPGTAIGELGIVSPAITKRLREAGIVRLSDLDGQHFPDVYDLINYGPAKPVLIAAVAAGVSVKFRVPDWSEQDWKGFLEELVGNGLVTWEDVAVAVLAELNPPQVGTAVANAVKHNYPKGQTMREVWTWLYGQNGMCGVSGKRLFLEADHRVPKDDFIKAGKDPREADKIENFQLLTKRQNVIKRASHRLGGISFANAAAVLMYVLFRHKPRTLREFEKLCRQYGLTMSGIRFQEAWAMAIWLSKEGLYEIEQSDAQPIDVGEDEELGLGDELIA